MTVLAGSQLRLHVNGLDYVLLGLYFLTVLGIGFAARRSVKTSLDFLLSGRAMPAWVTGLAFISANLGATEIFGMAANGAEYGVMTVHYYWIGAVPAMVFLGIVMMPFYYKSKVRSVPEFLRLRFNRQTQFLNAVIFAVSQVLIAGINLYALALVMEALLGWSLWLSIGVAAVFVLVYILLGGLSSAIFNEVLQFFVILAGLIPVTVLGLIHVGGFGGLADKVRHSSLGAAGLSTWSHTGIGVHNPMATNFIGIVLGLGFVLSFGYWTTNFSEVQRGLSARNNSAARRTPLIAAYPKLFIPLITVIPGLVALVTVKGFGAAHGDLQYNNAIPLLMNEFLPNGVLGVAVTGLLASFMAGMAANVSGFNTVMTYDIWQEFVQRHKPDSFYLNFGRVVTVLGIALGVGTAAIAASFSNIMNYMQSLFSFFNAPIFATFIIGLIWKRMSPWAGFWGLLCGVVSALIAYVLYKNGVLPFGTDLNASFWDAGIAFVVDGLVSVGVTAFTKAKPRAQLRGLVFGMAGGKDTDVLVGDDVWYRSPVLLGAGALVLCVVLYLPFL